MPAPFYLGYNAGMRTKLLLSCILLLTGLATAGQRPTSKVTSSSYSKTTVTAAPNALATGGNASNLGNAQSINYRELRQTPLAYAPDAISTAPCSVATSAGGSSPFFGAALGINRTDQDCNARALAAALLVVGARCDAMKVLYSTKAAKKAHLGKPNCDQLTAIPLADPQTLQVNVKVDEELHPDRNPPPPPVIALSAKVVPAPQKVKVIVDTKPYRPKHSCK